MNCCLRELIGTLLDLQYLISVVFSFFKHLMPGRHPRTLKRDDLLLEENAEDAMKSWNDSQSDLCSTDHEEEEDGFGENEDELEEMMDLSDLPTSHFLLAESMKQCSGAGAEGRHTSYLSLSLLVC